MAMDENGYQISTAYSSYTWQLDALVCKIWRCSTSGLASIDKKTGPSDLCWFKDLILMKYTYGSIEMDNRKNRKGILELFRNFNLL